MTDELKPCPYCGVVPQMGGSGHTGPGGLYVSYAVYCDNEECYAYNNWLGEFIYPASLKHDSPEALEAQVAAAFAWNSRPGEDALRKENADLRSRLSEAVGIAQAADRAMDATTRAYWRQESYPVDPEDWLEAIDKELHIAKERSE